jgi:hypothetical protein
MKIYDCFTFYNELDLLEFRLTELYDHVDYFVLVEANTTYTSIPKLFYFENNKERYAKWMDKIIHVKVEDMPNDPDAWVNDRYQRDQIYRGILTADDDDLIIVSDLDEIIRPAAVDYMRNSTQTLFALRMPLFNFKFNYMRINPGPYDVWGMAGSRSYFEDIKPDAFRFLRFQFMDKPYQYQDDGCEVIEHGGWQFSNLGDNEFMKNKLRSFAHAEVNYPEYLEQVDIDASIAEGLGVGRKFEQQEWQPVKIDSYFPDTLVNNLDKYKTFILNNATINALDILPEYPYNREYV